MQRLQTFTRFLSPFCVFNVFFQFLSERFTSMGVRRWINLAMSSSSGKPGPGRIEDRAIG